MMVTSLVVGRSQGKKFASFPSSPDKRLYSSKVLHLDRNYSEKKVNFPSSCYSLSKKGAIARIIELSKKDVLTAEYFATHDYSLQELETYKEICELSLHHNLCGTDSVKNARKTFLRNYKILLEGAKNEYSRTTR